MPRSAFRRRTWHLRAVAEKMAVQNINLWNGNTYAIKPSEIAFRKQPSML